ncbi:MAG: DUF4250 domain-containing protein [Bacillota bacterium]
MKSAIPQDPMMLLSFVNMKLRDFYNNLDALCDDMDISKEELTSKLVTAGFEYNSEQNKFW